jgi:glyoxylase-like metal-dependent hydrolase (beta-lactamase superfamily II)
MVHIREEGKFNENAYLLDGEFLKTEKTLALYVIESNGKRLMIDTGEALSARKMVKKLKKFDIFPIQQVLLTHAHWDHIQALPKINRLIKDVELEVFAHENALDVLQNPERMNEFFGYHVKPIEDVNPLTEGDIIELNGLKLKIHEFFGHTQDSIALEDLKNRILYVGDAILDRIDKNTYVPVLFGPDFDEESLLDSFQKLRDMRGQVDGIALAHYGVWKGDDLDKFLEEMEDLYFKAKETLIKLYNENPSLEYITKGYHDKLIPNSEIFSEDKLMGLQWNIQQNIDTMKAAGFIE